MKTLNVEDETWETLTIMKIKGKFSTIEDVIKDLIKNKN